MTPLMIVSAVPLYNIYSVIILTFCANNQDHSDKAATIKRAFKNILTNPIILGIAAGVPFSLLNIELPPLVLKTVTNVAQTATPMALLAVGAGFEGRKAIKKLKPTMIATFINWWPYRPSIFHLPLPWASAKVLWWPSSLWLVLRQRLPVTSWPKTWAMTVFCPPVSLSWQLCCPPSH